MHKEMPTFVYLKSDRTEQENFSRYLNNRKLILQIKVDVLSASASDRQRKKRYSDW